jgi:hypothetical protein
MKLINFILLFFLCVVVISAQGFKVEKVSGNAAILKGTSEEYTTIKEGDVLQGTDLLITDENSYVQLVKNSSRFILNSNAALNLMNIKKVSINDLILALTMEEIRNIPVNKSDNTKNTAVYGTQENKSGSLVVNENVIGIKKLNGARQLAESGYKESAIIVAKETYRKHPATRSRFDERIYFADLLAGLTLYEEALTEYNDVQKLDLTERQKEIVINKISGIKEALVVQ